MKPPAHLKLLSPSNGNKLNSSLPSTPSTATPGSVAQSSPLSSLGSPSDGYNLRSLPSTPSTGTPAYHAQLSPVSSLKYPDSPVLKDKENGNQVQLQDLIAHKHAVSTACGVLLHREVQRLTQELRIGAFGPGGPDAQQRKAIRRQLGKLRTLQSRNLAVEDHHAIIARSKSDSSDLSKNCERSCQSLDREIQHLTELLHVGSFGFGGPDEKQSAATRRRLGELRALQSRICLKHSDLKDQSLGADDEVFSPLVVFVQGCCSQENSLTGSEKVCGFLTTL